MGQEINLQNNYFVASKAMSPDAPTVVELKNRLDGLDAQIAKLKGQLTGDSAQGRTISASLASFEQLQLKMTPEELSALGTKLEAALKDAAQSCILTNEATAVKPKR